ncbi:putative L-asparaginase [Cyclospora cayetanensis]|uniref:asparaginase n=1 Tax=Cyclospora cayetanensis TaxID=88456 RepID=A0A1D3D4Q8_9EIME|nr:putative L-asparaginase [Cyclospora cayetanensis]
MYILEGVYFGVLFLPLPFLLFSLFICFYYPPVEEPKEPPQKLRPAAASRHCPTARLLFPLRMPQNNFSDSKISGGPSLDIRSGGTKQGHVVHGSDSSIVCVSAGATPLHMSAAADGLEMNYLSFHHEVPHNEGHSQPVTTALSAIHRVSSCPAVGAGDTHYGLTASLTSGGTNHALKEPVSQKMHGLLQGDPEGLLAEEAAGTTEWTSDRRYMPYQETVVTPLKATLMRAVDIDMGNPENAKPHVLIIILGGTICMNYAYKNTCLRPSRLGRRLTRCPELTDESLPYFDILEWDDLVDSSDMGKEQYCTLAKQIETYYNAYDGFVVLHGTDTMAYTAAVLSFMLENLGKCVVLTGSMLPMMHISSDAKRNVGLSLMVAGYSSLTEVVVVFGSQVLRGTRVSKTNCGSIDAFSSPNFPAIGTIGVDVVIHDRLRAYPPAGEFRVFTDLCCSVCTVKLSPSMPIEVFESVFSFQRRPFAVILELFGAGTAPNSKRFLNAIQRAIDSGIAVVASNQCQKGATNLLIYENGVWISSLGVICARDMTLEAITAKLYYLMGKGISGRRLKELMEVSMRGEVTVSPNKVQGNNAVNEEEHTEIARQLMKSIGHPEDLKEGETAATE